MYSVTRRTSGSNLTLLAEMREPPPPNRTLGDCSFNYTTNARPPRLDNNSTKVTFRATDYMHKEFQNFKVPSPRIVLSNARCAEKHLPLDPFLSEICGSNRARGAIVGTNHGGTTYTSYIRLLYTFFDKICDLTAGVYFNFL